MKKHINKYYLHYYFVFFRSIPGSRRSLIDGAGVVVDVLDAVFHGPALAALADEVWQAFRKSLLQQVDVDGGKRFRQVRLQEFAGV